jgi:hypothetical protein
MDRNISTVTAPTKLQAFQELVAKHDKTGGGGVGRAEVMQQVIYTAWNIWKERCR